MKLISYYSEGVMLKKGANNYPNKYINFDELIDLMKSKELKDKINNVRNQYINAKKRLPVALFNKFEYNLNTGFIKENPIKPFDVDLSDNTKKEIKRFENDIKKDCLKVIKSPSGKGLKFFKRYNFKTNDPAEYIEKYKRICRGIEKKYNIKLDYSQGRIKQPFFLTHIEKTN